MWKLKWCLDSVVQIIFLEWSLCYLVLFQAPFSFASSDFMAMFGNGMSYELLIAPVALYGSINIRQYMWTKFAKSFITEMVLSPSGEWTLWSRNSTVADSCVMRLCLFFGRVWGRRLCNFHIDCSYVWELIISVVNFDFTVSVSDSLGKQLKHSDVPFYYWWLFAAPLACWYLSGCFFNRLLIIKLIIQGGCL